MAETVSISLRLVCRVHQEADDLWVAGCPRLDVHSQGSTIEEAKSSLGEAVELFVESCIERDTLDEVLRDCGFHLAGMSAPEHGEHISVEMDPADETELLGESFPLDITVPAYLAALRLEERNSLNVR